MRSDGPVAITGAPIPPDTWISVREQAPICWAHYAMAGPIEFSSVQSCLAARGIR